ncbi:TerB family tellurite resistance protein [Ulvibacterium marinum]|uniref:TerB family tellurite resistance protein n=1 Tax=Ulvibacterium marinum TaxID=2419782 RepID=A0A3B0CFT0_9FLAO|nr:TerB family tellurite resistance protein [Ulvibacterium marinum]RKN83604.1 TerB family tellurite resistance protein [Ulvibacterium marinum]
MSVKDLYDAHSANNNLAHFASIASLAAVDGYIDDEEMKLLERFAHKLNVSDAQFKEVMKKSNKYPITHQVSFEKRLERFFDLVKIVFADGILDDEEEFLLGKYAIGLGFSSSQSDEIIAKSKALFTGKIDFEDYLYFMNK